MPEGAGPLRARTPDQGFLSSVPSRRLTGVHPRGLTGVRPGVEMPRSGVRADYRAAPVPPYKSDARTEALNSKVRWVAGERLPAGVPGGARQPGGVLLASVVGSWHPPQAAPPSCRLAEREAQKLVPQKGGGGETLAEVWWGCPLTVPLPFTRICCSVDLLHPVSYAPAWGPSLTSIPKV